jgi:hypothetical protein
MGRKGQSRATDPCFTFRSKTFYITLRNPHNRMPAKTIDAGNVSTHAKEKGPIARSSLSNSTYKTIRARHP